VRPFITLSGIGQLVVLAAVFAAIVAAPFLWMRGRRATSVIGVSLAVILVCGLLAWNGWEERRVRSYDSERIAAAASIGFDGSPVEPGTEPDGKVILLAIDGLSWNVMVPLMEAGVLPSISSLVHRGAFGYLDNGDDSLSPIVWTSIFSGRPADRHGISGYRKMIFPRSGRSAMNLLLMQPTIDTFYGLSHLVQRLPSVGLWRLSHAGSNDRRAPMLWDIASAFGKRVVVVDPLVNLPVKPVNGAMIDFKKTRDPRIATAYPLHLQERWAINPMPIATGGTEESYTLLLERLGPGVEITFELAAEFDPDLLVYYTRFADTVSHMNWDFWAREDVLLTGLPIGMTDAKWESLILDRMGDRLFRSYIRTDSIIGRFVAAFPAATIVIASDHGWTFSGYEHFGSPDGVLIVSGPAVKRAHRLDRASILDVTPTVLEALGIPVSRELEGEALGDMWRLRPAASGMVDRYPAVTVSGDGGVDVRLSEEDEEQLRALGYID
jgi:predicted AlkP superfamily phosphohydrolase/phosphomutase